MCLSLTYYQACVLQFYGHLMGKVKGLSLASPMCDFFFDFYHFPSRCPSSGVVLYKYNILARVIVENIIPRNAIINRGTAKVDIHILRDDFFDYHPLKNVIFILLYRT